MSRNKALKFQRMRGYFIEAANVIIQDEGIEAITTRKVADRAGYNVSTLYNYFDNVDHLLSISLTSHIGTFIDSIIEHIKNVKTPYETYEMIWFEFVEQSFRAPMIYYYIFFKNVDSDVSEVFDAYFADYPENWEMLNENMQKMFSEKNIYKRDMTFLENHFTGVESDRLQKISEINVMVYRSMMQDLQLEKSEENKTKSIEKYKAYFQFLTRDLRMSK